MKGNMTGGLILRFIGQIIMSAMLSVLTLLTALLIGDRLTRGLSTLRQLFRGIFDTFGDNLVLAGFAVFLFVLYLTLFQWRWFRYLSEMNRSVMYIAEGNFDHKVPIRTSNQLGDLAFYTNRLVAQLKTSLDDERKAEQTKNELITNVSHDLRTPLTSILGYLGLIEQDRYRDEVELRHYVQIAYDKSQRLNVLISDLFEFTRMRYDKLPLQMMRVNLVEMLGQLLIQYKMTLEEAGMAGRLIAEVRSLYITGDPNKLMRVFENLLSNAMTYGRDGKKVELRVREENGAAVVDTVNFGEPIPSFDLPYIFDRFYRVDKSRAEHSGGSGLGLAIAKSIVERHQGTIAVSSDMDMTVFEIRIPLAPR